MGVKLAIRSPRRACAHPRATPPAAPSLETLLDRATGALDELLAEVRSGVRDQRHFDALEERAATIAGTIRGAFRAAR